MRSSLLVIVLALVVVIGTPWFGAEIVSPATVLGDAGEWEIFLRFRVARLLLGLLAGASLAVSGCLFQSLLRNPLAEPYTLGVSSGAALGAVIAILLDLPWVWTGSVLGAALALSIILRVGLAQQRRLSAYALILAGVSVNSVCGAFIILLQSAAGFSKSFAVTMWLIGAVEAPSPVALGAFAVVSLPLMAWVWWKATAWDLLSMGETWAAGRGATVHALLWQGSLVGSLLTAATVSLTGPIGFVGLMVPHLVRRFAGASHQRLVPLSFVVGGTLMVLCDAIARTVIRPSEMPVGAVTAIIGGPGLIWILRTARGRGAGG